MVLPPVSPDAPPGAAWRVALWALGTPIFLDLAQAFWRQALRSTGSVPHEVSPAHPVGCHWPIQVPALPGYTGLPGFQGALEGVVADPQRAPMFFKPLAQRVDQWLIDGVRQHPANAAFLAVVRMGDGGPEAPTHPSDDRVRPPALSAWLGPDRPEFPAQAFACGHGGSLMYQRSVTGFLAPDLAQSDPAFLAQLMNDWAHGLSATAFARWAAELRTHAQGLRLADRWEPATPKARRARL